MPLQRRIPKFGFKSRKGAVTAKVRLVELMKVDGEVVDLAALKSANVINGSIKRVKVFAAGDIKKPLTIRGLSLTKGARAMVEAAGGKVEA